VNAAPLSLRARDAARQPAAGRAHQDVLDRGRSIALAATATIILALISLVLPNLWALTALSAVAVVAWPSLIGLFNWFTSKPDADARELPEGLRYWPDQPEPPSPLLEATVRFLGTFSADPRPAAGVMSHLVQTVGLHFVITPLTAPSSWVKGLFVAERGSRGCDTMPSLR
jgi:hypothetical protein